MRHLHVVKILETERAREAVALGDDGWEAVVAQKGTVRAKRLPATLAHALLIARANFRAQHRGRGRDELAVHIGVPELLFIARRLQRVLLRDGGFAQRHGFFGLDDVALERFFDLLQHNPLVIRDVFGRQQLARLRQRLSVAHERLQRVERLRQRLHVVPSQVHLRRPKVILERLVLGQVFIVESVDEGRRRRRRRVRHDVTSSSSRGDVSDDGALASASSERRGRARRGRVQRRSAMRDHSSDDAHATRGGV